LGIHNNWDIFVGLVANLPKDTIFGNVYNYKGMTFIEVDKIHSMVFNIYNKTCYDTILKWDKNNLDNTVNQMDQYLKRQNMKIIISYPFEFSCIDTESSLWNGNLYSEYKKLFEKSNRTIEEKIKDIEIISLE